MKMNYDKVVKEFIPGWDACYFFFLKEGRQVGHIKIDGLKLFVLETDAKMFPGCWKERLEKHLWRLKEVKDEQ